MPKWKVSELKSYVQGEHISSEKSAGVYLRSWLEKNIEPGMTRGTPEEIDNAWEAVKRAAERNGFPITPALVEIYAETRDAACACYAVAEEPAIA